MTLNSPFITFSTKKQFFLGFTTFFRDDVITEIVWLEGMMWSSKHDSTAEHFQIVNEFTNTRIRLLDFWLHVDSLRKCGYVIKHLPWLISYIGGLR